MKTTHFIAALSLLTAVCFTTNPINAQQPEVKPGAVQSKLTDQAVGVTGGDQYWIQPQSSQAHPSHVQAMPMEMSHQAMPVHSGMPAPYVMAGNCDCMQPTCVQCRTRRLRMPRIGCRDCGTDCGSVACPRCDGEICRLETKQGKETKTCFKVEQETVCIPPVRFPWQDCCPPGTAKTRLVTRLKVHKYECPNCEYKWTREEPKVVTPGEATPTPAAAAGDAGESKKEKADTDEVPAAPVLKGAFRLLKRQ